MQPQPRPQAMLCSFYCLEFGNMLTIGLKVPLYSGDMSSFCLGCCPPLIRGLPSFGGIIPLLYGLWTPSIQGSLPSFLNWFTYYIFILYYNVDLHFYWQFTMSLTIYCYTDNLQIHWIFAVGFVSL